MWYGLLSNPLGLIGIAFWLWMLFDCVQNERDRTWLYLMVFLNFIGALVYFVARYLPRAQFQMPPFLTRFLGRWTRKEQLWQAEAEVRNIGKAYQYVKLGDLLSEIGQRQRAAEAYAQALSQEPDNAKALWGAASVAIEARDYATARQHLETLHRQEPDFGYGDLSATYGQVLMELGEEEAARSHFETHVKRWSHPQSYVMLAKLYQKQGDKAAAQDALETMLAKVKSSPPYHYRKNRRYIHQGERLLRALK